MNPLISVVIPTYNRASDLKRALNSLISQTYKHWEAIVIDNHSTDNTDEVINALDDDRITLLKIHNNGVIAASRNMGIANANGEYTAFLDSDDWWKPNKLERTLVEIQAGADLVYHNMYLVSQEQQKFFFRVGLRRKVKQPIFNDLLENGNPISNSSVVVKSTLLDEVGGLLEDPAAIAMEDFDCWLKISRLTERFHYIDESLGYYWIGGGNTSSPTRDLKVVESFLSNYGEHFKQGEPWWLCYTRGRAKYLLGDKCEALSSLNQLRNKNVPLDVSLKRLWMVLNLKLRRAQLKSYGAHISQRQCLR